MTKARRDVLFLFGLILFHIVVNAWWLAADECRVSYLPHDLTGAAMDAVRGHAADASDVLAPILVPNWFLPVSGSLAAPFSFELWAFAAQGTLHLLLLILAVYAVGRQLAGREGGLLAAVLVSLAPFAAGASRTFDVHLLRAALVTLAALCFLRLSQKDYSGERIKTAALVLAALTLGVLASDAVVALAGLAGPFFFFVASRIPRKNPEATPRLRQTVSLIAAGTALTFGALFFFHKVHPEFA
ncbi:MAG TPA: glycosyltransferase family 39 protein, partial [Phycisphaerae bacterium]|nr:glycosyltransferase family 39 protein [Phycisphaerae bacterium]